MPKEPSQTPGAIRKRRRAAKLRAAGIAPWSGKPFVKGAYRPPAESRPERQARWREDAAKWRSNNRELFNQRRRTRSTDDPEREAAINRRHRVKKKATDPEFYIKAHRARADKERAYRLTDAFKKKRRAREHKARQNPHYRALHALSGRMRRAIRAYGKEKRDRFLDIVGCTAAELFAWIEAAFEPGMTWENYGPKVWHIDHVRPCSSFDLTRPEQQRICFHYTNLQPLWAAENFSKNGRTDWQRRPRAAV